MSRPHIDVQTFHHSGVWAKPPGALAVDTVFIGATTSPDEDPQVETGCYPADELPPTVNVKVTEAPRGSNGCAVIVSHLHPPRLPGAEVPQHDEWLV